MADQIDYYFLQNPTKAIHFTLYKGKKILAVFFLLNLTNEDRFVLKRHNSIDMLLQIFINILI
jgi:hypothetical protein